MKPLDNQIFVERLFCKYRSDLVGYLKLKFSRQKDCAEDIAQDAFIRLQRLNNVDAISNPKAHLYKTADNLAIDYQRRETLKSNYLLKVGTGPADEASEDTPLRRLKLDRQLSHLQLRLEELPKNCRKSLYLHRLQGLSYRDIAKELGVSVSSVEKYLMRALKHCKEVLEESNSNGF